MAEQDLRGKTALITGASSGLGSDFARILASRGCRLVLVARRSDRLGDLAAELKGAHQADSLVMVMDLADPESAADLHNRLKNAGERIDILINNAGYGTYGFFVDVPWEREKNMLNLDIMTLVHLTKLFGREMAERKQGWILLVSSIGAYQPSPTYASYAAAKSFVLNFGEAIAHELKPHGVKVSVLSPGVTRTEFLAVAGQKPTPYQRMAMMESLPVAQVGIEAMFAGKPSVLPGLLNKFSAWSVRFMPRRLMPGIAYQTMKATER